MATRYKIVTSRDLTVTPGASVANSNTGDQTSVSGNAGTATALQNARTIGGVSFDGTANITVASAIGGFAVSGGALTLGTNDITGVGSIGTTGSRVTKLWATDITATNAIAGSVTGNAATVTTNANLTGVITSSGNATSIASQTGTGSKFVVDTSPTLITPNLGTPASGVATNLTGTASGLTAGNVTTNANLTGPITSSGNATSIASQTGTGTKFVVDTSPTLTTPTIAQINNSSTPGVKLQLRTQTDNSDSITNATTAGVFVQYGWGQVQGAGATTLNDTVTFPTAFTTVLGVSVSLLSVKSSPAASDITALNLNYNASAPTTFTIGAGSISTSSFTAAMVRSSGTFASGTYYGYSWIAWGV